MSTLQKLVHAVHKTMYEQMVTKVLIQESIMHKLAVVSFLCVERRPQSATRSASWMR